MALTVTYGTNTALTGWSTALASVAASGTSTSGSVDNSTNKYPACKMEIELDGDNASSAGSVDLYLQESTDGGTAFSTSGDTSDMRYIGSVQLNGTTLVRKVIDVGNLPQYWKVYVVNGDATYGLGANTVISYQGITYADV